MAIDTITSRLQSLATPADVAYVQKYMGTPRPVLGVSTEPLRTLAKQLARAMQDDQARLHTLDALYAGPNFEHRALAGHLLHAMPAWRKNIDLELLRAWVGALAGWCEIDTTCQNGWRAADLLERWDEWQPFLRSLGSEPNLSLQRAALVLPLAPLRISADARLAEVAFANLDASLGARDRLITKAQSWLLRGLLKHHANLVSAYLDANAPRLPAFVVRETRSKLETGRK